MDESVKARIERAKELLRTTRNTAMATVNEDGSPHNTPFFFIHDDSLDYIYWSSHPDSLHCVNALRTSQIFVVLYESNAGGGLYIKASEAKLLEGSELETALQVHNAMRERVSKEPLSLAYYSGDSSQKMYRAKPTNFYVNISERDTAGLVIKEYREEISVEDLHS